MMAYLTEEQTGTEKSALFVASHEQLGALEATIADLRKAEAAHARDVYALAATRDKAARQASIQVRSLSPTLYYRIAQTHRRTYHLGASRAAQRTSCVSGVWWAVRSPQTAGGAHAEP